MGADNVDHLVRGLHRKEQMAGANAVCRELSRFVSEVGGDRVKNDISVVKLSDDRELFSSPVGEGAATARLTSEVFLHKASLGHHKRDPAVADDSARDVSRLRKGKLGGEDKLRYPHAAVCGGTLRVCNIKSEVSENLKAQLTHKADLPDIAN